MASFRDVRAAVVTALPLAVLVAVSACGPGSSANGTAADSPLDKGGTTESAGSVLTVAEALERAAALRDGTTDGTGGAGPTVMTVRGYIIAPPTGAGRLCTGLAGSYPPQCGAPSIELAGLDASTLSEHAPNGVRWSGETTVTGEFDGGVLRLRS